MASLSQLHKDWYQKTEEVRQLNAELSSARVQYDFLKKESARFEKERQVIEKSLSEREADVKQREQHINLTLARTEASIRKNIERLNDEIIGKQQEIKSLDAEIDDRRNQIGKLGRTIKSLDSDISRLQRIKGEAEVDLGHTQNQVKLSDHNLAEVDKHIIKALAELKRVSMETENLTKLKHDLDMYYMRIKNYYKKAGLNFIDEQYVGIPSN